MITVNIDKAKQIAHDMRRAARAAEMAPLDIQTTIPGKSEEAEKARQALREKYAEMQEKIYAAQSVEDLKTAIE